MEIWEYDLWLATACRRAQIQRSIKSIFAFVFLAYFFFYFIALNLAVGQFKASI